MFGKKKYYITEKEIEQIQKDKNELELRREIEKRNKETEKLKSEYELKVKELSERLDKSKEKPKE